MHKVKLYGKEYPSRMTMGAMIDFKRQTGKDVNDIGAELELLTLFMFCCVHLTWSLITLPMALIWRTLHSSRKTYRKVLKAQKKRR